MEISKTQQAAERQIEGRYSAQELDSLRNIVEANPTKKGKELVRILRKSGIPCFNSTNTWEEIYVSRIRLFFGQRRQPFRTYRKKGKARITTTAVITRSTKTDPTLYAIKQVMNLDVSENKKLAMLKCLL